MHNNDRTAGTTRPLSRMRRRGYLQMLPIAGGWLALTTTALAAIGTEQDEGKSSSWKQDVLVGNWNNEDNWAGPEGHKVPNNHWVGDEYWVYSVSIPPASFGIGSGLTAHLDMSPSIGQLTLSAGATVSIGSGFGLYLTRRADSSSGNINNGGTIIIDGGASGSATLQFTTDDALEEQKITGTGVILLASSTASFLTGSTVLNSTNHTIEGSGNVQIRYLTNQGLLRTSLPYDILSIGADLPSSLLTNERVVEAAGGGTVRMPYGRVDNTGGIIRAKDSSTVSLGSIDVWGGTLSTSGTGIIDLAVTSLANLAIEGHLRLSKMIYFKRDLLLLDGQTITNDGLITFQDLGTPAPTGIYINAEHIILDGNGTIDMGTNGRGTIGGAGCPGFTCSNQLTLGAGQLVQGAGSFGNTQVGFINQGTIRASVAGKPLVVKPSSGGLINQGIMEADGGTLWLQGDVNFVNSGGVIRYVGAANVEISNSARVAGGVLSGSGSGAIRIGTQASLQNLTNLGRIVVPAASTLNVTGTIVNDGLIRTEGTYASPAKIQLNLGNFTLEGTGALEMTGQNDSLVSTLYQPVRTLTNGASHTIRGEGTFGGDFLDIINHGRILANRTNPLTINPASGGLTNLGVLEAAPGATLTVWDTLKNYNATTKTLTGGRYEVSGTMRLPVSGLVKNAAEIVLDGIGSQFYSGASGTTEALGTFAENLAAGSFELRNGRDIAVGTFANAGLLRIGPESALIASSFSQSAGVTTLDGVLMASGGIALLGGRLEGTGTIFGSFSNDGELAPGNSPGTLSLFGDYLQTTGTLAIELGGSGHDRLAVGGNAALGGTLAVDLWSASAMFPFAPVAGSWFDIVTAETITGMFDTTLLPNLPGASWQLTHLVDVYGTTDALRLSVLGPPVPLPPAGWLLGSAAAVLALLRRRGGTG